MKLSNFSVKHYKSLENVSVDLNPGITVLAGQNASGKSNFVDSLRFLRNASLHGLDHAVRMHHGMARIRQLSTTRPYAVTFNLILNQDDLSSKLTSNKYNLEIGSKEGIFHINKESAQYYIQETIYRKINPEKNTIVHFDRIKNGHIKIKNIQRQNGVNIESIPLERNLSETDQMVLGSRIFIESGSSGSTGLPRPLGSEIRRYLARWKFSALYPNILRELDLPTTDVELLDDGSNWATIINTATKPGKRSEMLERIYDMMRVVLPDFKEVVIEKAGSYLIPQFKFGSGKTARQFDPVQLSDGTLRIFGILLSLYQRPSPQLLVIEEPEQTIHPGASTMLAEAFKEAAKTTQIIVTTHSPQFIDHFDPEDIRVVSMDEGVTKISRIKESQRISVEQNLMGLGEFMAAEGILPE